MDYNQVIFLVEEFKTITKKPETFLSIEDNLNSQLKTTLKTSYDWTKSQETSPLQNSNALPELIVQNFDLEQIWQQLELQNDSVISNCLVEVSKFVVKKDSLLFNEVQTVNLNTNEKTEESAENFDKDAENKDHVEDDSSDSNSDDEPLNLQEDSDELAFNSDDLSENDDIETDKRIQKHMENEEEKPAKKFKTSVVDDQFFKLDEMEAFLEAEEKKLDDQEPDSGNDSEEADSNEELDEDDDVDLFNDENELENKDTERGGLNNPKYKDFFGVPERGTGFSKNRNKFLQELDEEKDDEEDEEQENENIPTTSEKTEELKSTFELRQERLKKRMEKLEEKAISEKPWQLKGEITAENRPINSLLEEVLDFDLTARPAPVITEETTMILEDVIRRRIKDKAFDSVQRKQKAVETPIEYKKKLVLDQEKSKQSLAQIYEKEFLDKLEAIDPDAADKEEEIPELHKEIDKMMHSLFSKLDALSNFHFTPKPVQPELRIVSNLPAITMEEVAPITTSDANLLAPEEIRGKAKGDMIGKSERTDTDKKRERRKKKTKQKVHAAIKKKKEAAIGLGNKYSKEKAKKALNNVTKERNVDKMDESTGSKSVKSSKAFFSQLEDQVKSQIKGKSEKKKSGKKVQFDAKKLKF